MAGTVTNSRDDAGHPGNTLRDTMLNFNLLYITLRSFVLQSAGTAIHGASSALAKAGSAFRVLVAPSDSLDSSPIMSLIAANTDGAALVGTVPNGQFGAFLLTVSVTSAGVQTQHSHAATPAAAREGIVFPAIPAGEAVWGIVEVHPTGTGNFVGGTTALDDGTVIPNAVFLSVQAAVPGLSSASKIGDGSGTLLA